MENTANKEMSASQQLSASQQMSTMPEVSDAVLMSNDPNSGSHIQVYVGGRKYSTTFTKKFLNRKPWEAPNPYEIKSYIPGEVSRLLVKEGDKVKKGDQVMIYEAMKMKNIITAPMDARIKTIHATEGEKLPKGALLIALE